MSRKVVFFQDLSNFWFIPVKFFILRGYDVFVFNFNHNIKKIGWLKKLINENKIYRIYIEPATKEHGVAIDETEKVYEKLKQNNVVKCVNRFNKNSKRNTFVQKILVNELFEFFYINSYFGNLKSGKKYEKVKFVPGNYYEIKNLIRKYGSYSIDIKDLSSTFSFIKLLSFVKNRIDFTIYYLGAIIYSVFKLYQLVDSIKFRRYAMDEKIYKYAFPIDFPHQVMKYGDRGFDMLFDNKIINNKNTVFLINCNLNKEQYRYINENSYNYFNINKHKRKIDLKPDEDFHQICKNLMKNIFPLAISLSSHTFLFKAYLLYIKYYIIWNHIWSNCKFKNYIYSNKEGATQILINNFLNEKQCITWNYQPFIGGGYSSSKDKEFENCRHILWSFLNSNYFLGISNYQIKYHKLHKQKVDHYENIGYLYSEIVKHKLESIDRISFLKENFKTDRLEEAKIISIFDTSFVDFDNAPTTYDDCIKFYEDILRILHSNENLYFIIKPSKNENWYTDPDSAFSSINKGKRIVQLINKLKKESRVLWFSNSESILFFEFNTLTIAVSDLVVTHCMSSPTVEALGARKRAIWYENGIKRKGILYDQIDGLVIHGYENLEKRVNKMLYAISHEEYETYLDSKIKGVIEAKLDGKALTRFRQILDAN